MSIPLNDTDREILRRLVENRYTPTLLAEELGKTPTHIQGRLKRLREHGYVRKPGYGLYVATDVGKDRLVTHDPDGE